MNVLTTLQKKCLAGVIAYVQRHGKAPTRRELAKALGQKSLNGIRQLLIALEKKGRVRIDPPGQSRNIVLLKVPPKQLSLLGETVIPTKRGVQSHGG